MEQHLRNRRGKWSEKLRNELDKKFGVGLSTSERNDIPISESDVENIISKAFPKIFLTLSDKLFGKKIVNFIKFFTNFQFRSLLGKKEKN